MKTWVKNKLLEYATNFAAYVVCVVVVTLLMGKEIRWLDMGIMLIVMIVFIEVSNGIEWLWGKKSKKKHTATENQNDCS